VARSRLPDWAARLQYVRELLFSATPEMPVPPPTPKPTPIATLPSGLPIAEVIQRLSEIQQAHPDAVIASGYPA
jgi:hypothetical protein